MSNFDDYITFDDKPFAENINDALLLSNVFDLTVPIQVPTMFRNSTWINITDSRKCGVAILTLKESLPSGVSISTVDGKSVLTGTGTVKLGFYPNFNSFGSFKSIDWEETGTVQINLKTVDNTTIASNISKGLIQNPPQALRTLQEIVLEIVLNNSTLKSLEVVMDNKQQERYGAEVGITDVNGLQASLDSKVNVSDIADNLTTDNALKVLSAKQGKVLSDGKANLSHSHGNISNNGNIGSASGKIIVTGTGGALQASDSITTSKISDFLNKVYPVGSIYMSVNSTSPATLFGGTWEQLTDTFLYASTTADTGTTATGGSATVSLTEAQMPRHTHTQNSHNHDVGTDRKFLTIGNVDWKYTEKRAMSHTSGNYYYPYTSSDTGNITEHTTVENKTATNKYAGGTGTSESASNGSAHENMPPYMRVFMWKRTA